MIPPFPSEDFAHHAEAIREAVRRVLDSGQFILGPEVAAFEEEFARFCRARYAVGVGNGTDAIEIALRSCGIGPGDRVATVSHTAVATVSAIQRTGATPVFADIDSQTFTMDPASLDRCLGRDREKTIKAVVPVHLYGQMASMEKIVALATAHGCTVVEDCAQCHGASRAGKPPGALGEMAAYSFYPTKNLGAVGDGGMITTNDSELASRARALREYGWTTERFRSDLQGVNSRLDELQAAILRVKLPSLERGNRRRRELAQGYFGALEGVTLPGVDEANTHVFHCFVVRIGDRDEILRGLRARGVPAAVHYPIPIHLQPVARGIPTDPLPVTECAAAEVLTLPLHPWLTDENIDYVTHTLSNLVSRKAVP